MRVKAKLPQLRFRVARLLIFLGWTQRQAVETVGISSSWYYTQMKKRK